MKKIIILLLLAGVRLFSQENWFLAQSDTAVVDSILSTSELVEGQYGGAYLYPPINLLDGDFDTTWCEADEGGSGIGESITLRLTEPLSFDEIQVVNGFVSGSDYYHKNNRVARVTLTQTAREHFQQKQYALQDDQEGWQSISFDLTQTAQTISFRIDEVYKGFKYDDTCFSDIRFLMEGKVIPFENVEEIRVIQEEHSRTLLQSQKGAFMEQIKEMAALYGDEDSLYLKETGSNRGISLRFRNGVNTNGGVSQFYQKSLRIYTSQESSDVFKMISESRDYLVVCGFHSGSTDYPKTLEDLEQLLGDKEYYIYQESNYWSDRSSKYYLSDHRIILKENIDYIETETIQLVKLDGVDGLYINGVYYNVLDESSPLLFFNDGP